MNNSIIHLRRRHPNAIAAVTGGAEYPDISGEVMFFETNGGVLVYAEFFGLPIDARTRYGGFLGFHIHEGGSCGGSRDDPFSNTGVHYDTHSSMHPFHAGDLPPLLNAGGHAISVFLTNRITVREIVGRTVVIHSSSDDFSTQPSGNSGKKIACGVIFPR